MLSIEILREIAVARGMAMPTCDCCLMEKADASDAHRTIARRILLSADSTSRPSRIGGDPSDGHSGHGAKPTSRICGRAGFVVQSARMAFFSQRFQFTQTVGPHTLK